MHNIQKTQYSVTLDYFDTVSIIITPDNRLLLTKKPHKPFHKSNDKNTSLIPGSLSASSEQRLQDFLASRKTKDSASLASQPNYKNSQNGTPSSTTQDLGVIEIPSLPTPKKFTRSARQTILSVAGALEKEGYKPEQFWFFTGTLPGNSSKAAEGMSRFSSYIVNRFKQHLRDKGFYLTFNTWEWQKRNEVKNKNNILSLTPALHLHLVVCTTDGKDYSWLPEYCQKKWFDILDDIQAKFNWNLYENDIKKGGGSKNRNNPSVQQFCTKTVQCQKSPAAYLSKYVGKGNLDAGFDIIHHCKDKKLELFYPSSWWSVSKELRKIALKHTYTFSVRLPFDAVETTFLDFADFIKSISTISLKKFSPEFYPDYWFQSFYCQSSEYSDVVSIVASMFVEYQSTLGVREKTSIHSNNFDEIIKQWMLLPRNEWHYLNFVRSLPRRYSLGASSIDSIDLNSKPVIKLMREYYFQFIGNPEADKPLAISGF